MASLSKKAGGGGNRIHTARTQAALILGKTGARVSQESPYFYVFFFFFKLSLFLFSLCGLFFTL